MKIVLAPDKFKGSLTGLEWCHSVEAILKSHLPNAEIVKLPLADGGDGTIEVVDYYLNGKIINVQVNNPFFQPIQASYLFSKATETAFIEMAEASGLKLLNPDELDCKNATSFGTGELILDAISRGVKEIILGIGGSATNDCGIGMAMALGYRFLDINNEVVQPVGKNLSAIVSIDPSKVNPQLKEVSFSVACDVTNPLYGKEGAAYVYAKQKGATTEDIELLDNGLKDFSEVLDAHFKMRSQTVKGSGAAGGMGIGAVAFLNAELSSGIELIKKIANFNSKIKNADWIISGEGNLDAQTLSGKAIIGVLHSAKKLNIPVAALCGQINLDAHALKKLGILYSASLINKAENLQDAMVNGKAYLEAMTMDFVNYLK